MTSVQSAGGVSVMTGETLAARVNSLDPFPLMTLLKMPLAASMLYSVIAASSWAAPHPITKPEAARILESMGYHEIKVAFIIQGVSRLGETPNAAIATAVGVFNGEPKRLEQQFFFDQDLGWFCTEPRANSTDIRIWSSSGYSEVALTPRNITPPDQVSSPSSVDQLLQRR